MQNIKYIKLIFKLLFAVLCIYLVYINIDLDELWKYFQNADPVYIILATFILFIAQIISGLRMRYYFTHESCHFTRHNAVAIYFIGSFFNLVLPGGIGGDGYKVLLISRVKDFSKLTALKRVVSGRANGLLLLIIYATLLGFFSSLKDMIPYFSVLLISGIAITIISYFFLVKKILSESFSVALGACKYSFLVQGACVIASAMVFVAIGVNFAEIDILTDYVMLFMISSIVSILPISLGGIGLRELTFVYSATILTTVDPELGVAFSIIYYVINAFISFLGLWYYIRIDRMLGKG